MKKVELDKRLKADSEANGFKVEGDYLVFDKSAEQSYEVLPGVTLGDLCTKNVLSKTRLNKNLLLVLGNVKESYKGEIQIRGSYRSNEYDLLTFGWSDSHLYKSGDALSLGVDADCTEALATVIREIMPVGELGLYTWGCHVGWTKESKEWDKRDDLSVLQKVKDFSSSDSNRNYVVIGVGVLVSLFVLRKIFKK